MVLGLKGLRERRAQREDRAAVRKEQARASCPGSHPTGVLPGQLALAARQSPRPYNRSSPCKNTMGLSQPHLCDVGTHAGLCPPIGGLRAHHGGLHGNGGLGVGRTAQAVIFRAVALRPGVQARRRGQAANSGLGAARHQLMVAAQAEAVLQDPGFQMCSTKSLHADIFGLSGFSGMVSSILSSRWGAGSSCTRLAGVVSRKVERAH